MECSGHSARVARPGVSGRSEFLRAYIRPKRPLRAGRATVRFETAPGEQLQHDWGELWTKIGGIEQKVFIAVNTLGYSRRFHVWGTVSQDAAHTYESLVRSFAYLGGVTKTVLVDNQKSAVIAHRVGDSTRVFWTWRGITDLCQRAGRTGRVPRATEPWCAMSRSISLCATGSLRLWRISTSSWRAGYGKKPTHGTWDASATGHDSLPCPGAL